MKANLLIISLAFIFVPVYFAGALETEIFSDNFESVVENWNLEEGWSIIPDGENKVLQGTQHTFATAYTDGVANKLELRIKLLKGSVHLNIRSKSAPEGLNRYFIGLNKDSSYIQKQINNDFQLLKSGGSGVSLNEWHDIKIEIIDDRINVFSDNNLIIWAKDQNLLSKGGISFETHDGSTAHIDDVRVEAQVPESRELKAEDLFAGSKHRGDLTLEGRDFLILESGSFEQFGNIYLKDSSKLIIKDSTFKITRYQKLLNHWGIYLDDAASLEIKNSKLLPGESEEGGTLFVIEANGRARVNMDNSPTEIHLFTMNGNAKALVKNSEIVGEIGGLVSAHDKAEVKIINSKIGAVNLQIPNGATFEAGGLGTGLFKDWILQRDARVSGINYNIILQNTEIIPDIIGPGPYERSWPVFIDSRAKVKIRDSQLRKVVIELYDEKAEFQGLSLEKTSNFNYKDISLENIKVSGQWGIFPHGSSDIVVRDSEHFWTFIYDNSKLTLVDTHMNEFDPRNFRGEIIFENSRWDTAAEIIGNNDFTMKGSLEIGGIGGFSWENSNINRVYDVIGKPDTELILRKGEKNIWQGKTDKNGRASFVIKFEDSTFNDALKLKDGLSREIEVTFFSATPLNLGASMISKFISKIRYKISQGPPSAPIKFVLPVIVLIILAIIFFILRKKYFQKRF